VIARLVYVYVLMVMMVLLVNVLYALMIAMVVELVGQKSIWPVKSGELT